MAPKDFFCPSPYAETTLVVQYFFWDYCFQTAPHCTHLNNGGCCCCCLGGELNCETWSGQPIFLFFPPIDFNNPWKPGDPWRLVWAVTPLEGYPEASGPRSVAHSPMVGLISLHPPLTPRTPTVVAASPPAKSFSAHIFFWSFPDFSREHFFLNLIRSLLLSVCKKRPSQITADSKIEFLFFFSLHLKHKGLCSPSAPVGPGSPLLGVAVAFAFVRPSSVTHLCVEKSFFHVSCELKWHSVCRLQPGPAISIGFRPYLQYIIAPPLPTHHPH